MSFVHGHALLIGIGAYPLAEQLNAPQTAADAEFIAEVLPRPEYCAYPPGQVTSLVREQATRSQVLAALKQLSKQTNADSTVLLFYSGHGMYAADGTYYLTTSDTQIDSRGLVVKDTGVSQRELLRLVKSLPATRVLLIFNACHSGVLNPAVLGPESAPGVPPGSVPSIELTDALLGTGAGRVIISACREGQISYFDPQAMRTVFADLLGRTLQGQGIYTNKPIITVSQLYEALYDQVEAAVQKRWKAEQQPELTVSKGVGPITIAHYRRRRRPAILGTPSSSERLSSQHTIREVDPTSSVRALAALLHDDD